MPAIYWQLSGDLSKPAFLMPIRKPLFYLPAVYFDVEPSLQNTHFFFYLRIPNIWVSGGSLLCCVLSYVWRDIWVLFLGHSMYWADVLGSGPKAASSLQAALSLCASHFSFLLLYHLCWLSSITQHWTQEEAGQLFGQPFPTLPVGGKL